jgi:hypothetical protein
MKSNSNTDQIWYFSYQIARQDTGCAAHERRGSQAGVPMQPNRGAGCLECGDSLGA